MTPKRKSRRVLGEAVTFVEIHITITMATVLYAVAKRSEHSGASSMDDLDAVTLQRAHGYGFIENGPRIGGEATVRLTDLGQMALRMTRPRVL